MTLIYFVLVLGITVLIHELGHFIFAKRAGVYIYEFSIGMGPQIFKFNRKNDETTYSIRLFPIGGFVSMAGEDLEEDKKIPSDKQLCNKSWINRFLVLFAGIAFNFILAIIILFTIGLISGVPKNQLEITDIEPDYQISETGIQIGDVITKINGKKVRSYEELSVELAVSNSKEIELTVLSNGIEKTYNIEPTKVDENYLYGFTLNNDIEKDFFKSIKYSFEKTGNLIKQMVLIVKYLFTGKLELNNLSGPVGIYQVVDQARTLGFLNIIYLIAYLCINVGFINFIPFPAFDGGRILFLIIEKIKGSKVNPKIENIIHSIGFVLLMILMVFVTYNDIIRIFK